MCADRAWSIRSAAVSLWHGRPARALRCSGELGDIVRLVRPAPPVAVPDDHLLVAAAVKELAGLGRRVGGQLGERGHHTRAHRAVCPACAASFIPPPRGRRGRRFGYQNHDERLDADMLKTAEATTVDDPRLWALAYVEFYATGDAPSMRLLEKEVGVRRLSKAVADLAFYLMDTVFLPVQHGVCWMESWVEVDALSRTDPEFAASLKRRNRYRRQALGRTLLCGVLLRGTARDTVELLWLAYQVEDHSGRQRLYGSTAIVAMLGKYRALICHSGDAGENA